METVSSCFSFTHSWACFAEHVTKMSSDVNDGCETPFRGLRVFQHSSGMDFIYRLAV